MINPFASGDANAIREFMLGQLADGHSDGRDAVFRARAIALIDIVAPALIWMRDAKHLPIDMERIRFSLGLQWIWNFAERQVCLVCDPATNAVSEIQAADAPPDVVRRLRSYLRELPGYDIQLPLDEQRSETPSHLHGYAAMFYAPIFAAPRPDRARFP